MLCKCVFFLDHFSTLGGGGWRIASLRQAWATQPFSETLSQNDKRAGDVAEYGGPGFNPQGLKKILKGNRTNHSQRLLQEGEGGWASTAVFSGIFRTDYLQQCYRNSDNRAETQAHESNQNEFLKKPVS